MIKKLLTTSAAVLALFILTSTLSAQSVKLESGDLGFLKGGTTLNVEFVYDGLTVGKLTEQAYIDKRVSEANAKQAGTGDQWLVKWKADRTEHFEPKFAELMNKQFTDRKTTLKLDRDPAAKYTLVLKTTNLDPGYNIGIMRAPASVSTTAEFYDTKDRSKTLAVVNILKAPGRDGMGYDFDAGYRLQEGYAKTGKELGNLICKKVAN
ncbi:MAG TPA: hypothetical protein VG347_18210 [Verrucomicrobiae bacterium]|nr:hypothetical protein [Verrucomicrobiae bacterium]